MIYFVLLAFLASSEGSQHNNGTLRSCAGQGGEPCIFPFDYYGTVYYSCIKEEGDWIDPWCATEVNSDGEYIGEWAECNSECPVCETTDHHACDFPFKYNGNYQHGCVDKSGVSSCGIVVASDFSVTTWGECNGYCPGEYTGGPTTTTTTTPPTTQTTPDPGNCGLKPTQRIVGGVDASENSWPWQVSIQAVLGDGTTQHICGGSIFSYEYVISAAHCVKNYEPSQLIIVAGEFSLSEESGNEQRSSTSQIFVRDDFNGHDYVNDIALLHLETPFIIDEVTTNIICLPAQGADYSSQEATITGWGYTAEDGGAFSDILQEAVVQTMTDTECRNSNYNENYIYDHHICAAASGVDACAGDAGGPLMVEENGRWILAAVTSWGTGCARDGYPGVYTEMSWFADWVYKITSENHVTTTTEPTTVDPYPYDCGWRTNETCSTRIVNGEEAQACFWPWQAALLQKKGLAFEIFCGGAIYNEEWIITTAACVEGKELEGFEVEVGEFKLSDNEPGEQFRPVVEIQMHPEYNASTGANDIALVKVVPRMHLDGKYVSSVCMPDPLLNYTDYTGYATGWGLDQNGAIQEFLQEVQVSILNECEEDLEEGQLCATSDTGDACTYDEGGPLVVEEEDDHWYLAGLISQPSCGQETESIYTDMTKFVYWLHDVVNDGIGPTPPPTRPDHVGCGVKAPIGKIVGGDEAEPNEWPWQLSIQVDGTHSCGGVVFSADFVLTAAHCVNSADVSKLTIVAAEHDLTQDSGDEQIIDVAEVIVNPDFDGHDYVNDIAILRLAAPMDVDEYLVNSICIPEQGEDLTDETATITGWGYTAEGGEGSNVLMEAEVTTFTDSKCRNMGYKPEFIYDQHICAGYQEGGTDSCKGDSGGPLVVQKDDGRWYLAGLTSWGTGCGRPQYPGVYTEMAWFVDWVYTTTGAETTTPMTPAPTNPGDTTTTPEVTTGQPVGPCFTTGSCDIGGDAHIGTLYGIASAEACQAECANHSEPSCDFFTWYGGSKKCRFFSICNPSGENCGDCVKGPSVC